MRLSIDAYERMAGNVLKIYEQAELEMTRRVANRVKRGVTQPGWTEKKYSEMKAVTRQMSKVVDSLHRDFNVQAMQYVETGYEDGRTSFINEAREFTDLSQIHELTPTAIKVANIMGDLDMSMSAADRLILRQANDAYANIIGETSALIATGSYTEKQAVQIALNRFADKGISSFVDKAGRHWDMSTYAEMATLTAIERATRQGYTDTMQEFGFDLAIISSHYGACPLCEAWENVVISISGKDTRYPSLADAEAGGCFHPRCMHVFSTYYDGITRGGRDRPSPVGPASPGYAARSQQRALERQERKWKRRMAAATTPEEERAAYARVRMYQDKIRGLVADYNNTVDPSVDYLPRKYDREGGRVKLSDAARKLKPVAIPDGKQTKVFDISSIIHKITAPKFQDEFKTKGYVGLSGSESDAFIRAHHNKAIIGRKGENTMDGAMSRKINEPLRRGEMPSDPKAQSLMSRLDKAIQKNELPTDMTLYRGLSIGAFSETGVFDGFVKSAYEVSMDAFKGPDGRIDYDAWGKAFEKAQKAKIDDLKKRSEALVGRDITDKGFMQVSASSERNIFGFSDINLQIHAPAGLNAYISDYIEESEMILARNTTFRVIDVTVSTVKAENGAQKEVVQVIAEIVEDPEKKKRK